MAGEGLGHEIMPDGGGELASGLVVAETRRLVEADPDHGDEVGGEAREPGVGEVLGGAGLARDRAVEPGPGFDAGAARHHVLHHRHHLEDGRGVGHGWAGVGEQRLDRGVGGAGGALHLIAPPQHMAVAVLDHVDQGGGDDAAPFGERGIGAGKPKHGGLDRPERGGKDARHVLNNAEIRRRLGDRVHADEIGHAQRHQVARVLERLMQRHRAIEVHLVIIGPPFALRAEIDHEGRVEEALARRDAALHRGEIDEGLEARARLAVGLGGAVELADRVRKAAREGEHAAGARIERDQGSLDLRDLAELEADRSFGPRLGLDHHHVAGGEDVAHPARDGAEPAIDHWPRPGEAGEFECAGERGAFPLGVPFEPAQAGARRAHLEHHGEPPGGQHAARRGKSGKQTRPAVTERGRIEVEMLHRAAPAAMFAVIGDQSLAQHAIGHALEAGIEGRIDQEPPLGRGGLAELGDQALAHLVGEIGGVGIRLGAMGARGEERLGLRGAGFGERDGVRFRHAFEHPVAAGLGGVGVEEGIVVGGRFGQRGERRRLGQGDLGEGFGEIGLGGGGHAIGLLAEIDLVEIELEDPFLGERLLDAHGEDRLADLARKRPFVAEQHVLGELLGDGRGADGAAVVVEVAEIGDRGAQDSERVDAAMDPEILVLGGDEGVAHHGGDGVERREDAPLAGEFGDQRAIGGEDAAHHRGLVGLEPGDVRKIGRVVPVGAVENDEGGQHGEHAETGDHPHQAGGEADEGSEEAAAPLRPGARGDEARGERRAVLGRELRGRGIGCGHDGPFASPLYREADGSLHLPRLSLRPLRHGLSCRADLQNR